MLCWPVVTCCTLARCAIAWCRQGTQPSLDWQPRKVSFLSSELEMVLSFPMSKRDPKSSSAGLRQSEGGAESRHRVMSPCSGRTAHPYSLPHSSPYDIHDGQCLFSQGKSMVVCGVSSLGSGYGHRSAVGNGTKDLSRTGSWKDPNPGLLEAGVGPALWGTPESWWVRALLGC